jgi:chloramphenicol O-acetyltransferase
MLNTKEFVKKIKENNGLHVEKLINNIQKELKVVPRYAKKIDTNDLQPLLLLTYDEDTIAYQKNIIEFLENIKEDILHERREQIAKDEENLK